MGERSFSQTFPDHERSTGGEESMKNGSDENKDARMKALKETQKLLSKLPGKAD